MDLAERQEVVAKNRAVQRQVYGQTLDVLLRQLMMDLGINQVRLADVLGVSEQMLSQLINGYRAKSRDPGAGYRLQLLCELAEQVATGRVPAADTDIYVADIKRDPGTVLVPAQGRADAAGAAVKRAVREIQSSLRAVATAGDLLDAAELLDARHPELAAYLRVYGAARTPDAIAHYRSHLSD
ncbi:helix-turn-helix transcriptional regulator [Streptomyces sp. YC504]|uniref:Helix-turn-helix transcriptional regulator n=1 Tax=Streptomyces mesophilus TaxID=1775132 RepID=A0A6G4XU12_9ACTN|nr:helix-turn-helix transcriptional regulator [Streptomyces mesophilus]NGO81089.1 helix-turn-helix transcriptional regulator [Streptomyces mesophilus]